MTRPLAVLGPIVLAAITVSANTQEHNHPGAVEQPDAQHHQAVEAMSSGAGHHHDPHMKMTSPRPLTQDDARRGDAIVKDVSEAIERYRDYRVAIGDGYKPFLPHLPLPEYHFTNYTYGFLEALRFDIARPTSLLYKKRGRGYELVGAMYTAPKTFTEDQLHERIPLSVAQWHAHVNICLPPRDGGAPDWSRFGLKGSIASEAACRESEGRWMPQVFGWMVHVYPYERQPEKIWRH